MQYIHNFTKKTTLLLAFFLFSLTSLFAPLSLHAEQIAQNRTYYFGIVPQQSASRLAQMWVPFIREISFKSGLKIEFATTKDIPTFEKCLAKGAYDFAYMNPYHYSVFHEQSGYEAFAHQSHKKLKGIIVVHKDSKIKNLKDLEDHKLAFPSPAAFGASILPRIELQKNGINHFVDYIKSHDSVYRSVVSGFHDAGGGVYRTFHSMGNELKEKLRILYETTEYTPHAFAALPQVPYTHVERVLNEMLAIANTYPKLMLNIRMKGFTKAEDKDWDDIRNLKLTQHLTKIESEGLGVCRLD